MVGVDESLSIVGYQEVANLNQYINELRIHVDSAEKLEDILPTLNRAPQVVVSEVYTSLSDEEKRCFEELFKEYGEIKNEIGDILNEHLPEHQSQIDELTEIISKIRNKFPGMEDLEQKIYFSSTKPFMDRLTEKKLVELSAVGQDQLYYNLAKTSSEGGAYKRALAYLGRVKNITPEILYVKGRALHGIKDDIGAAENFRDAISYGYPDVKIWDDLYHSLEKIKLDDALKFTDKMLLQGFDKANVWVSRGIVLEKHDKDIEYLSCLEQAIKEDPKSIWARNNKGLTLFNIGRSEEAIEAYDKAIEIGPNSNVLWKNKGLALERLGRKREAKKCYSIAKELKTGIKERSIWKKIFRIK